VTDAASAGLEAAAVDLYRALHRPPPRVLVADAPHRLVGLAATLLRPRLNGSSVLVACTLLASAAVALLPPVVESRFPPAAGALYSALVIAAAAGLGTAGQRSPALWVRFAPMAAAILAAAAVGASAAGWAGVQLALALLLAAYATATSTRFLAGDLGGRLLLRWRGHPVPLLGSRVLNETVAERWQSALADPEAERDRHRVRPAPSPEERAAAARVQALIERLPLSPWPRDLAPVLGRGVEGWRQRGFGRAYELADPPRLLAAALALDREAVAAILLEHAVVALAEPGSGRERGGSTPATAVTAQELGLGRAWRLPLRFAGPRLALRVLAFLLDREPDPALRWAGIERLGPAEVVRALGREPVDEGPQGRLYRIGPEERPTMLVRVPDPAPGGPREHWLPVPPHVATAREAVAWTFGAGEHGYSPAVEA
jgi:hypothetical protein